MMVVMRFLFRLSIALLLAAAAVFRVVTRPADIPADTVESGGNPEAGALVFAAAGCASCHLAPETAPDGGAPVLAGGKAFPTQFGTFYAPNISPDIENGI